METPTVQPTIIDDNPQDKQRPNFLSRVATAIAGALLKRKMTTDKFIPSKYGGEFGQSKHNFGRYRKPTTPGAWKPAASRKALRLCKRYRLLSLGKGV